MATPAADSYSLGVMFVYLLTGIWYEPGSKVFKLLETLEYRWIDVLPRLLSENPADRPTNLKELAAFLRSQLQEPVSADAVDVRLYKRLAEPEFYCTSVTYSAIPATKQVDSIRMRGTLEVGNTSKAYAMVNEIAKWMKEDFGAVDQRVVVPAGTVAYKKFKIGKGMDVEVAVKWNQQKSAEKGDASIEISFTTGELAEENRYERQELGAAVDAARISVRYNSNVNYYTVRPKVTVDAAKRRVVY